MDALLESEPVKAVFWLKVEPLHNAFRNAKLTSLLILHPHGTGLTGINRSKQIVTCVLEKKNLGLLNLQLRS